MLRTIYHYWYHTGENLAGTPHPRVMRLRGKNLETDFVEQCLAEIAGSVYSTEGDELKRLIRRWVPEYVPCLLDGPHAENQLDGAAAASNTVPLPAMVSPPVNQTPELSRRDLPLRAETGRFDN